MKMRNKPCDAAVYGIDLGKNVFHVVGVDSSGALIQKASFRRETLLQFFSSAAPALVGMEACPGSQWLARKIQALGHKVRIIPAQFVKPYVKSNKNDLIDAAAIAEAVTRPTMRFVEVKSVEQVDLQALHRIRDQMMAARTRLICQMRAFCLECGVATQSRHSAYVHRPRFLAKSRRSVTPNFGIDSCQRIRRQLRIKRRLDAVHPFAKPMIREDLAGASGSSRPEKIFSRDI